MEPERALDANRQKKMMASPTVNPAQSSITEKAGPGKRRRKKMPRRIASPAQLKILRAENAKSRERANVRRFEILRHLCNGLVPKKIATLQKIPLRTIRSYTQDLHDMSGTTTREQLGVWAIRQGHVKL